MRNLSPSSLSSSSSSSILASAIIYFVSSLLLNLQCLSFIFISHLSISINLLPVADGTCNSAQSSGCLQAAAEGQLDQLPGGGQCLVKQYVQYTHLCTVNNYLPSVVDYCCCLYETKLLCCRYHQGWYHFRCMESEDELEIKNTDASYVLASVDMPLLSLLPAILCPLAAIAICVVCWTKCWCYRYDTDSSSSAAGADGSVSYCCCCSDLRQDKKSKKKKKKKTSRSRGSLDDEASAPLKALSSTSELQQPSSVQCLRTLPSPPYTPAAVEGVSPSPVTHRCLCSGLTKTQPSAPVILDDLFTSRPEPSFGSISASGLVAAPQPEVGRGRHVCLCNVHEHPITDAELQQQQQREQYVYCACAAGPCEQAHFRCNESLPMVRLAHAHPCVDGLPPAYEAIHRPPFDLQRS